MAASPSTSKKNAKASKRPPAKEETIHARAEKLVEQMEKIARYPSTEMPYWIRGEDDGEYRCYECCFIEFQVLLANGQKVVMDGGWSGEFDSPAYCCDCGVAIEGMLTDEGCIEELRHFAVKQHQPELLLRSTAAELIEPLKYVKFLDKPDRDVISVVRWLERLFSMGRVACGDGRGACTIVMHIAREASGTCALSHFPRVSLCSDHRAHTWAPAYLRSVNDRRRQRQAQGIKVKGVCRG